MILHTRCFSVNCPVCIGIELRLERKTLACCRECIFGNIDPHAKGSSLLSACNVTENDYVISVKENVVSPPCKISIGIVKSPCESIVTVSNLTSIGKGRNKCVATNIIAKLTCKRIRANERVVYTVVLRPLLGFLKAHETSLVAIFKVPNNFRALAEFDSVSQNGFTISDGNINACDRSIIGGGEVKAIQNTSSLIGQRHRNCVGIHIYIGFTRHGNDRKLDGANLFCGGIRNHGRGCGKLEDRRIRHGNGLSANHLAAGNNLDIHSALLAIRNELAVLNGAEGGVRQSPSCISRHIHSITVGVNSFRGEVVDGLGGKNIEIGFDIDIVQNAGGSNVGNDEDAVGSGTLCAVTGNGTHGEIFFANALGNEGGRTAAVTVGSPLTAQRQHGFAFFVGAETNGIVGTTAVIHTNDQSTIFLDTDHGTSSIIIATLLGLVNKLAILNNHTEGYTNCMQQGAICEIAVKLGLVKRLYITGDVALCILKYVKDRGSIIERRAVGRNILAKITNALSIVYKYTRRVGIVVKVGVHTADNVVSEVILVILCHFGKFLMTPVCFIHGIFCKLINLLVSRDDGYIGIGRVNLDNMEDLSAGAGCIIEHDFRLNSSAGDEDVIFFGDYVVVAVGAEACSIINYIVVFPIGDGRQRSCRQHADQRHNSDDQSYYAISGFSHNLFFLS